MAKKSRDFATLESIWTTMKTDDELVAFIDSLNGVELKVIELGIMSGMLSKEPVYLLKDVA